MKLTQISKMVACILLVFAAVSLTTILSVESMRTKVFNYVFHKDAPYTEIEFEMKNPEYIGDYVMGYIPSGYDIIEKYDDGNSANVILKNDSAVLLFSITPSVGLEKHIDTEDSTIEELTVNGCDAVYSSNDRTNILIWTDGDKLLTLDGKLDKRILVKIAENIKRK